jgi:hypothetical protein
LPEVSALPLVEEVSVNLFRIVLLAGMMLAPQLVRGQVDPRLQPYVDVLQRQGHPPLQFVLERLDEYDLILFDDAWHPAAEPFEFYTELVRSPEFRQRARTVFFEVFSINKQGCLDAYLESRPEDRTLLYPAFQDDFSGTGWPLESYFSLLHTIYEVNQALEKEQRIRVVAVNAPTYWSEIRTPEDVALFRKTLIGNDYTMYRTILDGLDGFSGTEKGIFLTNTRHAYKGIRKREGSFFWNAGTFLHQWHPGKTYSIRFHNMTLSIEAEMAPDPSRPQTTAGMEKYRYSWIRMAGGLWDSAFAANGNRPIALPLQGNVFGEEAYVGNHMHSAAPGQTMVDAYDALLFLAPLERLHNTARVDFIYTPEFKRELARRYRILYTPEQLEARLEQGGVDQVEALIDEECAARPEELIPQAKGLGPMDAWEK